LQYIFCERWNYTESTIQSQRYGGNDTHSIIFHFTLFTLYSISLSRAVKIGWLTHSSFLLSNNKAKWKHELCRLNIEIEYHIKLPGLQIYFFKVVVKYNSFVKQYIHLLTFIAFHLQCTYLWEILISNNKANWYHELRRINIEIAYHIKLPDLQTYFLSWCKLQFICEAVHSFINLYSIRFVVQLFVRDIDFK
jgi:hypothetical protein